MASLNIKRAQAKEAIEGYFSGKGKETLGREFTSEEKQKFLADHFNSVADGKLGSAGDYISDDGVLSQFTRKLSAIDKIGGNITSSEKNKLMSNFKSADDLSNLISNASEHLGRTATGDDILKALRNKDFSNNPGGYGAYFTRMGQRETGIAQLQSETGDSLSEDDIKKYSDIDKFSDSDFMKEGRKVSQNFTPSQKWLDSAKNLGKTILGEDPSETDVVGFARKLASGEYNEQELVNIFKMDPKYGQAQDKARRETLNQEFTGLNDQFLKQAGQNIQGQFAAQGRGNSSAMTAQLAQVAQNLGTNQQQFLQGIAGQQLQQTGQREYQGYLQSQAASMGNYDAFRQYVNYQQQQAGAQRQGYLGQSYGLQTEQRQRGYQIQDFNMQQSAYDSYLKKNQQQAFQNNMFQLVGSGIGAYGTAYGGTKGFGSFK